MQSTLQEPADDRVWRQVAPLLEDAMGRLGEKDRNAVVLRFFENKSLAHVGAALGASEDAAKMRVNRALEKLRKFFTKRGIALSITVIAGAVSVNSVQAAPVGLAATVAAAAKGTLISATITTLVKGTMKTMTWLKLKFAAGVGVAALLAGGVATVAISHTGGDTLTAQKIAGKSRDVYAALSSYSDSGTVVFEIGSQNITTTFNTRLQRPNLYRIDWTQTGGLTTTKGTVWSDGSGDYSLTEAPGQKKNDKPQKMRNMKTVLASAAGLSGSAASTIPGAFFNQDLGDVFIAPVASGRHPLQKEQDAKVGDVDCYVVSSVLDFSKMPDNSGKPGTASTTLWIGKDDFLIHQCRTKYVEKVDNSAPSDQAIDDAIKKSLEMQNKPATPEAIAAMRPQMKAIMKQVQSTLKSGFESGVVFTQTHENIVVNEKFSPTDFEQ
jgi:outer membrane lipoprotein-sorting protein